jgi:hypothetical protein
MSLHTSLPPPQLSCQFLDSLTDFHKTWCEHDRGDASVVVFLFISYGQ